MPDTTAPRPRPVVAASTAEAGSAPVQGRLWGARARDWAEVQEATVLPLFEAIADRLAVGAGTRVLDVGCGAGLFLRGAADRGAEVAGLDAAAALLAIARRRLPGADLREGEMERLPWADASFDVACGINAFQYATRPVAAVAEAARVVRPGGLVALATWGRAEDCQAAAYLGAVGRLLPPPPPGAPGPFALSEPGALGSLARAAGLQPTEEADVEVTWEYPDEPTLLRGLLSAGPAVRAIAEAGEARVRDAVLAAVAPCRTPGGAYRLHNVFRCTIAAHEGSR
jgi:SAM-dependent methyltransferase